ncbi:MAG TPA: DUF4140 domain-containing protein [Fimbriimonas sp.]|nr:DUF4140 domain-containing protein [Fimbriimonas sp.]
MLAALALGTVLAQKPGSEEVTVYNQGFALVKEVRSLNLKKGRQTVEVRDVPSQIDSTSVGIRNLLDPGGLQVLEQNYQYDLISPEAILNKSVGQRVRFIRTIGGQRDVLEGVLLNAPTAIVASPDGGSSQTYSGMAIKTTDGRIVLDPTGEVEVTSVPAGLISVPTLMWDLTSKTAGPADVELSYITHGVQWSADYVLTLDGNTHADLQGWVTMDNQSGATWSNARLKLLAGDVNIVQPRSQLGAFDFAAAKNEAVEKKDFQEQSLFEYHLYTLQRPATIRNKETKQLALVEAHGIPFTKKLIVDSMQGFWQYYPSEGEVGTGPLKTQVRVEFQNDEKSHLGMPLPKGKIRVYQRDSEGSVQMLGENTIDHTPRNERISLVVGNSFDVVASRKRTAFKRISSDEVRESFEIEVRNRKKTAETVHVYERRWGDWRILEKNHDFTKLDSNTADFVLKLQPNEVQTVSYTVQSKW